MCTVPGARQGAFLVPQAKIGVIVVGFIDYDACQATCEIGS